MNKPIDQVRDVMAQAEDIDLPEDLRADATGGFDEPPAPTCADGDGLPPEAICAAFPANDYGNGQRFRTHFGEDVMWVPRVGWFTWTGRVWAKDPDEIAVRRYSHQLGERIMQEIPHLALDQWQMEKLASENEVRRQLRDLEAKLGDGGDDQVRSEIEELNKTIGQITSIKKLLNSVKAEHRRFAKSTGNSAKIENALKESAVDLAVQVDDLDAGALDVACENGVLRFSVEEVADGPNDQVKTRYASVELVPHDRTDRITKMMPVEYDPDASSDEFDRFLARIQPDPEMRGFLRRWHGLSMTALLAQRLAFYYGAGANGKSVLMDLIARILGDYAATAKIESLTGRNKRGGGDATPDLVPLIGARFVRASEPDEGERLQEGLIKELTGGEPILVRALHSDFVEVRPCFKLTIGGNHKPEIRGTDDGIWRRVMLVPFDVQIPEAERDEKLIDKLFAERAGVLNWLVGGLLEYLERGLMVPEQIIAATQEFREESDPVGAFLEACCVVTGEPTDTISARDLGDAFNLWLDDRGEGQWQPRTVAMRLKDKSRRWKSPTTGRGFTARKASTMSYDGIRLNDVFGQRFREVPRDAQGRILRNASTGSDDA